MNNPNPAIILVSLVTRSVVSRTTFADWATENGECIPLDELQVIAAGLREKGAVEINDHLLIDATPTDAEMLATVTAKAKANSDVLDEILLAGRANSQSVFIACVSTPGGAIESGATMDETIAKVRANILSPKDLAEKKRADARRLMEEAEQLHPGSTAILAESAA